VWYFNVLIDLFQVEICLSQQHEKSTYYFGGHKIEEQFLWNFYLQLQFINQCVFSFRFTNLLVCFLFRPPSWPCGSSCRGGVTRKDAWWLHYFAFVQPLFLLYKIVSDYKDKFQIENFVEIQGEHKVFPWLQTFITRKVLYIENKLFF